MTPQDPEPNIWVSIRLKFCREVVNTGKLKIKYVKTADNTADLFMKPLPAPQFRALRDKVIVDLSHFFQSKNLST